MSLFHKPKGVVPEKQAQKVGVVDNLLCLGTVGSGKTVVQNLLMVQAFKQMIEDPDFDCHIIEKSLGAAESVSNIYEGKFPPKTTTERAFEAILEIRETKRVNIKVADVRTSTKMLHLNFIDVAGEIIQKLIEEWNKGIFNVDAKKFAEDAPLINQYLLPANGLLIIAPVTRAAVFKEGMGFLDNEPKDLPKKSDLNLYRFLEAFQKYKAKYENSPRIQKTGFIFTKTDLLHHPLASFDFDLSTYNGRMRFITTFYRLSYSALRWYNPGLKNVRFFPSYVNLQYDPVTKLPLEWPPSEGLDCPFKIALTEDLNPDFSDDVYNALLKWFLE